jgi:hypothetical protein
MFGKWIQSSTAEPSFFYLMMAATCLRRATSTRHPNETGASTCRARIISPFRVSSSARQVAARSFNSLAFCWWALLSPIIRQASASCAAASASRRNRPLSR